MLKIFNQYKDDVVKQFGDKPMYEDQIRDYGYKHFPKFDGVYPHDKFTPKNNKCYIINTGNSKSIGYHWVAFYITPTYMYVFDSYHRDVDKIFNTIEKFQGKRKIVTSKWPEAIQRDYIKKEENICGQLCLAWLHCINDYGIKNAILI